MINQGESLLPLSAGSDLTDILNEPGAVVRGSDVLEISLPEVRTGGDRRKRATPMISRYTLRGRRRGGRRDGEQERIYVDQPGGLVAASFLSVLALSAIDAYYTLRVVSHGVEEANPVMRLALSYGHMPFVVAKMTLTLVAIGFLCLHKNWPSFRLCLAITLICYTLLTGYHLYGQIVLGLR